MYHNVSTPCENIEKIEKIAIFAVWPERQEAATVRALLQGRDLSPFVTIPAP